MKYLAQQDDTMDISLVCHRPYDVQPSATQDYEGEIILPLSRSFFTATKANLKYLNSEYESEKDLNHDIAEGILFADGQYNGIKSEKLSRDLATLGKYQP